MELISGVVTGLSLGLIFLGIIMIIHGLTGDV